MADEPIIEEYPADTPRADLEARKEQLLKAGAVSCKIERGTDGKWLLKIVYFASDGE